MVTVMPFTPALVALDIDGTCVTEDGRLAPGLKAAVDRAIAAGAVVAMATGRGWQGTHGVVTELGLPNGQHVIANGAMRVSFPPLAVLDRVTFDARDVVARVHRLHPRAALAVETGTHGFRATKPFPPGELTGPVELVPVAELAIEPVSRVIVRDAGADEAEFADMVTALGLQEVSYFVGWSCWLDIAPPGVDKAFGLAALCAEVGVAQADVLAIGDGRNDIAMLAWAGRGVAVGDAAEDVRRAADAVTGALSEGGTAAELDRWFG